MNGPRRSPERKKADKRLDKALTAYRVSRAERARARMLFSAMLSYERQPPVPFARAHQIVLCDLREGRRLAERTHFEPSPTRPSDDAPEPFGSPHDRSPEQQ